MAYTFVSNHSLLRAIGSKSEVERPCMDVAMGGNTPLLLGCTLVIFLVLNLSAMDGLIIIVTIPLRPHSYRLKLVTY